MDANTDDATTLCTLAIQAIRNFDTRAMDSFVDAMEVEAAVEETKDAAMEETKDDADSPATTSAQHILAFVPVFLWAVAIKKIQGCAYETTDSASAIKWCSFVRTQCFGPSPAGTNPSALPGLATNPHPANSLDLRFGSVVSGLERVVQLADERMKTDQLDKDQKSFKKLEPFTQEMILFASEPLEADDDTGNPVLVNRTTPVESYARLIRLGNVAQAKLHLDNVIMVKHKCPVSLPLATINAIREHKGAQVHGCESPSPEVLDRRCSWGRR
jgi:hypothetical protein